MTAMICPAQLCHGGDQMSERRHQREQLASQRDLWMLPPCQVSVWPINPCCFWEEVREKAIYA